MRYLSIAEVLETYQRVMQQSGGLVGIRDLGGLESAIAQPYMTFDGNERYPSLAEKPRRWDFLIFKIILWRTGINALDTPQWQCFWQ